MNLFLCLGFVLGALAYLPGVTQREFSLNEEVPVEVNKLSSTKTQLPYEYYSLPFCPPLEKKEASVNIGEVLSGDVIQESPYKLFMRRNENCKVLCSKVYTKKQMSLFRKRIKQDYRVNWIIDNMPGAIQLQDELGNIHYKRGFPLGYISEKKDAFIYNHIRFLVSYHVNEGFDESRVVFFEIEPFSVKHEWGPGSALRTCNEHRPVDAAMPQQSVEGDGGEVVWTYDVIWRPSEVKWASRWDVFLRGDPNADVHWFSTINSFFIALLLTGVVAYVLMRTLRKDISRYNTEETTEEIQEETGWKLVHGDVFRPPTGAFGPMLLSVFIGSGVQVLMMLVTTMIFAVLGFLSPAIRGGLMSTMLLLFVFMGTFGGYVSARLYKMMGGKMWKRNMVLTATVFPGTCFTILFVLNLFVWAMGSSAAVPFLTFFELLFMWFGISMPLVLLGAYFGFKKDKIKSPVRTNQIPRQVPDQPALMNSFWTSLMLSVLPFGAVFIELYFIMTSLWLHQVRVAADLSLSFLQIYYVFGSLVIVLIILVVTCAEVAVVLCYIQLCCEDYNWWWRSFMTTGTAAVHLLIYSVAYFFTKLDITQFVSGLLYFGYMAVAGVTFFLITGTIGFLACLFFVRKIYSSIKVE